VLLVGLTGGIGSGKSTIATMLAECGAVILSADAMLMEIRRPGGAAHAALVDRFGSTVVAPDGTLNRQALAAAGDDEAARGELRALTYPHLDRLMAERIASERDTDKIVVLDIIPRLAEGGKDAYDLGGVIVIDVPVDEAVRRLTTYRGWTEEYARARIATQMSREERRAMADVVIDNSGPVEALTAQIEALWAWLLALRDSASST
jgi:dephospho-CoA kinase